MQAASFWLCWFFVGGSGVHGTESAVEAMLDDWHRAAAVADEARYFDHIAETGVFLGTDAGERWVKPAFREFAHPYFAKGKAWSFKSTKRFVTVAAEGKIAWFDEQLETKNLGPCRGSGVVVLQDGRWRIAQYNLSTPIPNAIFPKVKEMIEAHERKPTAK